MIRERHDHDLLDPHVLPTSESGRAPAVVSPSARPGPLGAVTFVAILAMVAMGSQSIAAESEQATESAIDLPELPDPGENVRQDVDAALDGAITRATEAEQDHLDAPDQTSKSLDDEHQLEPNGPADGEHLLDDRRDSARPEIESQDHGDP